VYALSITRVCKECGELQNVKVAQASFCCTNTQCSKVGPEQTRAQGIPHNGISGSHNRTGSAPREWPSFGISGNVSSLFLLMTFYVSKIGVCLSS
jgi:hypothetical protein